MLYIVLIAVIIAGGYFAFRYVTVMSAIREMNKELQDIQKDLTQNQMLHLPTPNGHLGDMVCSFNEILEKIRKEQQKYEKQEKELKRQIENISHDLRTPLTVILGYLKFIKNTNGRTEAEQELRESLEIIERKAESMKTLVTQFYDFSRLNADDYKLTLERVDISRILRETLMGNFQILESAHLEVEAELPEHPVWATGDTAALERIFSNLLQNAGRYAKSFLHIQFQEDNGYAVVSFSNDTEVLSEKDVPHLFERFYMQDDSRSQGGTGLGLTVARALAQEMGAMLEADIVGDKVHQTDKNGTVVCFTLKFFTEKLDCEPC